MQRELLSVSETEGLKPFDALRSRIKLPLNPSVPASPRHLPLHKGGFELLKIPMLHFLKGFNKNEKTKQLRTCFRS